MRGESLPRAIRNEQSSRPTRTISDGLRSPATSASGTWAVTKATVIRPPVRHIAKSLTPHRCAKNSVCPGNTKPALCRIFFETGPVTTA
jgi:hypothetical protein